MYKLLWSLVICDSRLFIMQAGSVAGPSVSLKSKACFCFLYNSPYLHRVHSISLNRRGARLRVNLSLSSDAVFAFWKVNF